MDLAFPSITSFEDRSLFFVLRKAWTILRRRSTSSLEAWRWSPATPLVLRRAGLSRKRSFLGSRLFRRASPSWHIRRTQLSTLIYQTEGGSALSVGWLGQRQWC